MATATQTERVTEPGRWPTREALEIASFAPDAIPWDGLAFRTTMWMLRDWIDRRRPDVTWPPGDLGF